jgi:hypothetical protein
LRIRSISEARRRGKAAQGRRTPETAMKKICGISRQRLPKKMNFRVFF